MDNFNVAADSLSFKNHLQWESVATRSNNKLIYEISGYEFVKDFVLAAPYRVAFPKSMV